MTDLWWWSTVGVLVGAVVGWVSAGRPGLSNSRGRSSNR
jgi:hypothetical protein